MRRRNEPERTVEEMSKVTELTCIRCPIGCAITVTQDDEGKVTEITGNSCQNGYLYAGNEVTNPTRIVTSTVRVDGGELPVVSVKTSGDIPKGRMFDCMKAINKVHVKAPVSIGDVACGDRDRRGRRHQMNHDMGVMKDGRVYSRTGSGDDQLPGNSV